MFEKKERFLECPKCRDRLFYTETEEKTRLLFKVNYDHALVAKNPGQDVSSVNTENVSCMGCSWKGSIRSLKKANER